MNDASWRGSVRAPRSLVELVPRGARELKDAPGTWELFALRPEPGSAIAVPPAGAHVRPSDRMVLAAARVRGASWSTIGEVDRVVAVGQAGMDLKVPPAEASLTVAVTGPTGTFGFGLMPLLQQDDRIEKIVGIARRPFDPLQHGWTKMEYRRGDVREPAALEEAFLDADVVVHLAFMITGTAARRTIREINVEGTLNAFRAAAAARARRFVYASSVAAYGFHRDNPVGMTEEWPVRPADHLFYAQEKAEIERLLQEEAEEHPELDLYLLRPPIVLGPHALGAKDLLPGPLGPVGRRIGGLFARLRLPVPALAPTLPVQFVHEDDVGQAFLLCIVGAGPPGAYNITGDGVMTGDEVAREFGLLALPVPGGPVRVAARALAALPFTPPAAEWVEAISHPAIMDAGKAKRELGWKPRYSSREALRDTVRRPAAG